MNSARRIFVALGIPEELQKEVSLWQEKHAGWPACQCLSGKYNQQCEMCCYSEKEAMPDVRLMAGRPVRWVNGENLHITLMPPWHEKNVDAIISALEKLEGKFALFPLMEPLLSNTGAEYAVLKEFKL
ncbi:MAG TPA: 2'-5' RNA ligase family protein [Candidatus Paceibacterota bacterium]